MGEPAQRVLGRYALEELIAGGGMGQVWRGRDTLLGRPVAVKLLRSEYSGDPTFLARFRTEAVHAAALNHPNIAAVYDYGEVPAADGGEHFAYLVMELVQGRPLSSVIEEGPLSTEATLSVLRQTAEALAEAHHAGLVHRDVKPGNILVSTDEQVKITDFGIAWSAGSVPLTQAGQVLGTPQYLSPELAVGGHPSPASDVYSLGLVGYECLTGQPAFTGDTPVAVALKQVHEDPAPLPDDLPPELRDLVDGAVAKDPAERIPDGDAFVAAIDRVWEGQRLGAGRTDTQALDLVGGASPARTEPPRGRRRLLLAAVLVFLAAGLAAVVGLVDLPADDAPTAEAAQPDTSIVLDDEDYVGRPVDEVAADLVALGLTVQRQSTVAPGVAAGVVTELSPVGASLEPGASVTVVYAADGSDTSLDPGTESGGGAVQAGTEDPDSGPVDAAVAPESAAGAGSEPSTPGTSTPEADTAGSAVGTGTSGEVPAAGGSTDATAGDAGAAAPSADPTSSSTAEEVGSAPSSSASSSTSDAAPTSESVSTAPADPSTAGSTVAATG